MQYWHFMITGTLILALVMTSGCAGLLTGDLRAEIRDDTAMTIPLPLSSVLSVLASRNTTTPPVNQASTGEKVTALADQFPGNSPFHVKSSSEDDTGIDTNGVTPVIVPSPQGIEHGTPSKAPPGESVIPLLGTTSCSPVAGAKVVVTLVGTPNKTHITDCITRENGDFTFEVPPLTEKSTLGLYTFNFEIIAPGHNLPAGSSNVVTDMANVSDGPLYTFNVCYQQPSEPDAMAITRGGIAVIGRISS
jgi:hypothetical protein